MRHGDLPVTALPRDIGCRHQAHLVGAEAGVLDARDGEDGAEGETFDADLGRGPGKGRSARIRPAARKTGRLLHECRRSGQTCYECPVP